jgi:hypothetical protein
MVLVCLLKSVHLCLTRPHTRLTSGHPEPHQCFSAVHNAGMTLQHKNRDVLVQGPEIEILRVRTRHLTAGGSR